MDKATAVIFFRGKQGCKADTAGAQELAEDQMPRLMQRYLFHNFCRYAGNILLRAVLLLQNRTYQVLHLNTGFSGEGRVNCCFIQDRFQLSAGMIADHLCQVIQVDAARNFFSFEVISNDLLCIRRRWRTETDLSVKTPGAPQRIRQLPNVICGRDYKYGIILDRVDPCLHGDILRCITARAILVGKLVHIIQKNNGRRFSRRFGKGLRNAVDKGIATLVAAYRDGV